RGTVRLYEFIGGGGDTPPPPPGGGGAAATLLCVFPGKGSLLRLLVVLSLTKAKGLLLHAQRRPDLRRPAPPRAPSEDPATVPRPPRQVFAPLALVRRAARGVAPRRALHVVEPTDEVLERHPRLRLLPVLRQMRSVRPLPRAFQCSAGRLRTSAAIRSSSRAKASAWLGCQCATRSSSTTSQSFSRSPLMSARGRGVPASGRFDGVEDGGADGGFVDGVVFVDGVGAERGGGFGVDFATSLSAAATDVFPVFTSLTSFGEPSLSTLFARSTLA